MTLLICTRSRRWQAPSTRRLLWLHAPQCCHRALAAHCSASDCSEAPRIDRADVRWLDGERVVEERWWLSAGSGRKWQRSAGQRVAALSQPTAKTGREPVRLKPGAGGRRQCSLCAATGERTGPQNIRRSTPRARRHD